MGMTSPAQTLDMTQQMLLNDKMTIKSDILRD